MLHNLGVDHLAWTPAFADYKIILEQLKSKDEMQIYEAVTSLSNQLSVAQENTLSNFTLDQYIPALIEVLKRPTLSDIANEINMYAVQCLTNLMDIFPSICNSIINHGGVKCLCDLMERNIGFIDLSESCIKAFEKISNENPYTILTSGAIALCLNMMDFFEFTTQKRIITILMNISRHSASEGDFDDFLMPLMPNLCMLLQMRNDQSEERIEQISFIVYRICESFMRYYSPLTHFDKISFQYEKLSNTGIFETILQIIHEYSIMSQTPTNQIGKHQTQKIVQKMISSTTIQNFLKTLTISCRFSAHVTKQLLDYDIFKLLDTFLPSQDDHKKQHFTSDQFPYVIEVISLLDIIFPERAESLKTQAEKMREPVESAKRNLFASIEQHRILFVAEKLLPKVFFVYENNIAFLIRIKTLQIIDKIISLFNEELLNNFIEPYSFAKFIYANFRNLDPNSIQLCLQMIQKLILSNPKTYTLPLMREGVSEFIKKLKTKENLEKTLNLKIETDKAKEKLSIEEETQSFLQAKVALLNQSAPLEPDQRKQFEQTLQRYLEAAKLSQPTQSTQTKLLKETCDQIITLANQLCSSYFENQQFLNQINSHCEEEFQMFENLKQLAEQIKEESTQIQFNFNHNQKLMSMLAEFLTSNRHIMCYEFKQSGLLEALELYLTFTPNQSKLQQELKKSSEKGEEMKKSEEMQINTYAKDSKKITKKEARGYILRLKTFTHYILTKTNGRKPFNELIQLCHDLLSQSENQIFEGQLQKDSGSVYQYGGQLSSVITDINQSVTALKQLTRRIRVNLVYDPQRKFIDQQKQVSSKEDFFGEMQSQNVLTKNKSENLDFIQLQGSLTQEAAQMSKVFIKRNYLYSELKQVLISVEQCASLWLLEDFLRNKIKSIEDVKTLKLPPQYLDQLQNTQKSQAAKIVMEKAMGKMRELLEGDKNRQRSGSEELTQALTEEIINAKELTEQEQSDIIKQLEIQTLTMLDELYSGEESEDMRQSFEERLLSGEVIGEEELNETELKLYEFQRTLEKLRTALKEKKIKKNEQVKQPIQEKDEEMEDLSEEVQKESNKDVEMTDEEEEHRREIQKLARKYSSNKLKMNEIEVSSSQDSIQQKEILSQDLEELIKANGEDIEYEFYQDGKLLNQNQTIFEILKNLQNPVAQKALGKYGQSLLGESSTIYFTIKDKNEELKINRKDSILEFAQRRERTKSEAVDDISVSSVNFIVQQLIEKEFQVFQKEKQKKQSQEEDNQMEQSLKILKVLNFICKNSQLLNNQGVQFLINSDIEEMKGPGLSDFDLQISLNEIHPNVFYHHKLDSYIVKNIQDPYNLIGGVISDTLQQIFRNCPFLFPFQTRQLFFKLISFIGAIDMNRSIYFLRQFLKQRGGKVQDERAIKISKQKAVVDRNRILDSAFTLMKQLNKRSFLEIEYKDEQGTGLGPTLEFYYILAEEIKTKKPEIWRKGVQDNTLFPAPISMSKVSNDELQKIYEIFRLAGTMMAKSIVDDRLIDLPLSSLWWDILLGRKMNIFDLEKLDKDLFKIFAELQVLANKKREIDKQQTLDQDAKLRQIHSLKTTQGASIDDLGLFFVLPGYEFIELRPNGKDLPVTIHNLQEFIDLFMHYTFHDTIKVQTSAFKKGFNSIFPIESMKPFSTSNELEDMICGTQKNEEEWKNPQRLQECIVPAHGYHSKSQEYLNFIRFMTELDHIERRKFLKFVTGSPRLPNGGFSSLEPKLTVVMKKPISLLDNPDNILPSVMTCQNYVKLPSYSSYEILKSRFQLAYNEGSNNFTLS